MLVVKMTHGGEILQDSVLLPLMGYSSSYCDTATISPSVFELLSQPL